MNTKKWLALLTALMMLSASMVAFADSPSEMVNKAYENGQLVVTYVSAALGALPLDESTKTAVDDLLESLTIEVLTQKGSDANLAQASVYLGETEAIYATSLVPSTNDGVFFGTTLLGDALLYATPQDTAGLFMRLMDFSLSMDTTTPQTEKDDIMTFMQNYVEVMLTQAASADADAGLDIGVFSSPKAEALVAKVSQSIVTTQGTFETEYHDSAVTHITLTITKEDITTALQILLEDIQQNEAIMDYLRSTLDSQLPVNLQEMTADYLMAQLIEMLPEEMDEAFHYDSIPVDIYLNATGQVVCIDAIFQSNIAGDSLYSLTYLKQTQADGSVVHLIEGVEAFGLLGDGYYVALFLTEGLENIDQVELLYQVIENAEVTSQTLLTYVCKKNYADDATASDYSALAFSVNDGNGPTGLELYVSNEATFDGKNVEMETWLDLYEFNSEDSLATVYISTFSEDTDDLIVPPVSDALRPGAMTDDELTQWLAQVQVEQTTALQTIITALPASVLNILMGQ